MASTASPHCHSSRIVSADSHPERRAKRGGRPSHRAVKLEVRACKRASAVGEGQMGLALHKCTCTICHGWRPYRANDAARWFVGCWSSEKAMVATELNQAEPG